MPVCFKVYLRETGGMRSAAWEKTTTVDQDAAGAAFEALLKRRDLDGKGVAAVLSYENKHLAFHRFDRLPGDPDYWRDRTEDIPWPRETARRGRGNTAGQGRQAKVAPEGGASTTITVRVAERQKKTFLRLGGADWLRGVLDEDEESEKTA